MRTRLGPLFAASIVTLALVLPAQAQLYRTNPAHMGGTGAGDALVAPDRGMPDYRTPNPRSRVLMRRRAGLLDNANSNPKLARACREGSFKQVMDRRFVAVLDKKIYGAAVGNTASLYDPGRMAQDSIVYAFVGQGTTNCRVYPLGAYTGG